MEPRAKFSSMRLARRVSEQFGLSARAAAEAIRNGRVDLGDEPAHDPGLEIPESAPVSFHPSRPRARKVQTRLNVLFEDAHLLIVEKPAGVLTLPTEARERDTLLERVSRYLQVRYGGRPYVGVVHRLDRDTSGTVVIARSGKALRALQQLFRGHDIERQYLAVAEGSLARDEGTIDLPLIAAGKGELRRRVARGPDEAGRHAVTHYKVLDRFGPKATLVACWLETGRTHQIRIHLAAIGHPVAGDPVYKKRRSGGPLVTFERQALHARTLGFVHPFTGERVRVELEPPADFRKLVARLAGAGRVQGQEPSSPSAPSPARPDPTTGPRPPLARKPRPQVSPRPAWKIDHRTPGARRARRRPPGHERTDD